jgi:DNA-binding NarL/FixJ family response regulator
MKTEMAVKTEMAGNDSSRIRVLVIDDHPIMRVGIAAIIQATADMVVVAQTGNGEEAIPLFEKHLPDITLVDLRLPGMSGVEVIRTLMARHADAKFVVLTTYEGDEEYSSSAGGGGAELHHQGDAARCAGERAAAGAGGRAISAAADHAGAGVADAGLGAERAGEGSAAPDGGWEVEPRNRE